MRAPHLLHTPHNESAEHDRGEHVDLSKVDLDFFLRGDDVGPEGDKDPDPAKSWAPAAASDAAGDEFELLVCGQNAGLWSF